LSFRRRESSCVGFLSAAVDVSFVVIEFVEISRQKKNLISNTIDFSIKNVNYS